MCGYPYVASLQDSLTSMHIFGRAWDTFPAAREPGKCSFYFSNLFSTGEHTIKELGQVNQSPMSTKNFLKHSN